MRCLGNAQQTLWFGRDLLSFFFFSPYIVISFSVPERIDRELAV